MNLAILCLSAASSTSALAEEVKSPRKPANSDNTSACIEKKIIISNKYCTAAITGVGGNPPGYGVVVHILDPRNGKEVNKEYVVNGVTEEQAMKVLDSATCE